MTFTEFMDKTGLKFECQEKESRTRTTGQVAWTPGSRHFDIWLSRGDMMNMMTEFSQGPGISEEPTARVVLECLQSDALAGDYDLQEFCENSGFTEIKDLREAEKTFKACRNIAQDLKDMLGKYFDDFMCLDWSEEEEEEEEEEDDWDNDWSEDDDEDDEDDW